MHPAPTAPLSRRQFLLTLAAGAALAACSGSPAPQPTVTPAAPPPTIGAPEADRAALGRYERVELTAPVGGAYDDPFDSRQVAFGATLTAPSGRTWEVPGFWDGKEAWRVRFTPGETGGWRYALHVRDANGTAQSAQGSFDVTDSERHGWLQVASWLDPKLSPRYLAHHDGTPFYGVGRCEAFTLGDARTDDAGELTTLARMRERGENLAVWWPHYTFTFFRDSVTTFDRIDLQLIDQYLASAERLGIVLVYTVWDHNLIRGAGHPWGQGRWDNNGFRTVTPSAADFFTSEESWRWQENLYRYIIARWGYSPAIVWMTASELDGSSAGAAQDTWHARINEYFARNDPYRHPTTASLSGDKFWTAGFAVTDIPQVHLYEAQKDAVKMGDAVAEWTARMWESQAKPNVVGEFGTTLRRINVPLVHNGIWAGLAAGAAITPLRWTDRGSWGRTNDDVSEQLGHLARFVDGVPFPSLGLGPAQVDVAGEALAARALASQTHAIVWAQDRGDGSPRAGVTVTVRGLADGSYAVRPYDTWAGEWLPELALTSAGGALAVALPEFTRDIALRIEPAG